MNERNSQELEILRHDYPKLEFREEGSWIYIPDYKLPEGIWNRDLTAVCFQIPLAYPGEAPYAFYIENSLVTRDTSESMASSDVATTPYAGEWRKISWAHNESWRATDNPTTGSNLLGFARSFRARFTEGK